MTNRSKTNVRSGRFVSLTNSLLHQLRVNLRLYFRNKMALLYGYLFPTIFLVAFWVLYRHEPVPLVQHMGELLTVTVLGGACFGLPTTMVSERERGVWRRYRLAPVSTASLVASTITARYVLLITAGLLQLALAMGIGMPVPDHPIDLWLAFTFVAFAFLGLGLVIAMLADNVPAVQALGQCIFLPMLIIGGVAVRLESLPVWAQHVSAFFPGRYAVELLQGCVTGDGLGAARFSLWALLLIGAASGLAGTKLFRWDARERFAARGGKSWVAVALAAWVAVGVWAESNGHVAVAPSAPGEQDALIAPDPSPVRIDTGAAAPAEEVEGVEEIAVDSSTENAPVDEARAEPPSPATSAAPIPDAGTPAAWQAVTIDDIDRDIRFDRLPPDEGLIAPIARTGDPISTEIAHQLQCVRTNLPVWRPGDVDDPVQRVRNYLYVAAVPDMFRLEELERWVPQAVFAQLQYDIPREQLIKILYWIAMHPDEGDDAAADRLRAVCIDVGGPSDMQTLRERTAFYALKLLGRLTGEIASD